MTVAATEVAVGLTDIFFKEKKKRFFRIFPLKSVPWKKKLLSLVFASSASFRICNAIFLRNSTSTVALLSVSTSAGILVFSLFHLHWR